MQVTFDDKSKLTIYMGEERTVSCYVYDETTFKPINLGTDIPSINIINADNSCLELVGSVVDAAMGLFDITFTSAQSLLIVEATNQDTELKIDDGATGIDLERLSRNLDVFAALC